MSSRLKKPCLGVLTLLGLAGCAPLVLQERPAWRAQADNACLARGMVRDGDGLMSAREISGPGICGLTHPFKVTALAGGTVTINATQTLDCPMIEALDGWIKEVVQPAAQARFGEPVARINAMGSYSCRGINNMSGANLSEHAFGNAIDIGGFVLAGGRELNIMRGFNGGDEQESAFLHEVHAGACGLFTTVLGPGYNILHYNHFHVDLAMHGATSRGPKRYCKPVPPSTLPEPPKLDALPDPPAIEEEMDIARAPMPEPGTGMGGGTLVAALPPPPARRAEAYAPLVRPPAPAAPPEAASRRPGAYTALPKAPGLVTFAIDDPTPARPATAAPPRRVPRAPPPPEGDPMVDGGEVQARERDRSDEAMPRAPRAAPDGKPSDWDVTSSVPRR